MLMSVLRRHKRPFHNRRSDRARRSGWNLSRSHCRLSPVGLVQSLGRCHLFQQEIARHEDPDMQFVPSLLRVLGRQWLN